MADLDKEMGNFLNASNVKIGDKFKIVLAKIEPSSFTGKPALVLTFEGGMKHSFGMQKLQPIKRVYGADTDKWIGQSVKVTAVVPTAKGMSVLFEPMS